jgi:hypothetical protein
MREVNLTEEERRRFTIAPEALHDADSEISVQIAKTISDPEFAKGLVRRFNRSGRAILRAEHAACRNELSDDAAAFIHQNADIILRAGPSEISVAAYNKMANKYIRLCQSVPQHLMRTDATIAEALSSAVKRLGNNIKITVEVRLETQHARQNLWRTQSVLRQVLSEFQLTDAQDNLNEYTNTALYAGRSDRGDPVPPKADAPRRERVKEWTADLGNCRFCGKPGHLNRDCTSPKKKTWKKKKDDTAAAKATPPAGTPAPAAAAPAPALAAALLANGTVEHVDYTCQPAVCDQEIDLSHFFAEGSHIVDFNSDADPASTAARALCMTADPPTQPINEANSLDDRQPVCIDPNCMCTSTYNNQHGKHCSLGCMKGKPCSTNLHPTPFYIERAAPVSASTRAALAQAQHAAVQASALDPPARAATVIDPLPHRAAMPPSGVRLNVPPESYAFARANGALWDDSLKTWWASPDTDIMLVMQFSPTPRSPKWPSEQTATPLSSPLTNSPHTETDR